MRTSAGRPGRASALVSTTLDATGGGFDTDVPVEIGVQLLKPGETLGMTREAGELATPTPTADRDRRGPDASGRAAARRTASSALTGWLLVLGLGVAGLVVGLLAAAVLSRRAAT